MIGRSATRRAATLVVAFMVALAATVAAGTLNTQVEYPSVATSGYIDPTVASFNSNAPMRCTANVAPGAAYTEQNRAAFQLAVTTASGNLKWVYLPPCSVDTLSGLPCPADNTCSYPISRKVGASFQCGVDFTNLSNVTIVGYGAVVRSAGDLGNGDYWMVCLYGTTHVRILGVTWSQRDVTNFSEQTHALQIGRGKAGFAIPTDDIEIVENKFIEGKGGDCIRVLGTVTEALSRVNIINNTFTGCDRSDVGINQGFHDFNIAGNTFLGTGDQDIDFEPTQSTSLGRTAIVGNFSDRSASPSPLAITFSGKGTALNTGTVIADNIVLDGYISGSLDVGGVWLRGNYMATNRASDPMVYVFRRAKDLWITDNFIRRGPGSSDNYVVDVAQDLPNCTGGGVVDCLPHDVWIRGNRLQQYAQASGIGIDSVKNVWVTENVITYHNAANASSSVGYRGARFETVAGMTSAWITENESRRDVQIDGVTQAGLPFAGFIVIEDPNALGHISIRDNRIDGASNFLSSGATLLTEGPAVITGNVLNNVAGFIANGGLAKRRTESTPDNEVVASGALAAAKSSSELTTAAPGTTYSLADCPRPGATKHVKAYSVAGGADGTLTPAHFGDGTAITWTGPAFADLACDLTGKWWLLGSSGIAVTP